ncbi:Bacteroides conjugative transposon TraM protein [Catalinimonas alkaloidigena]|uniref:Bacteroides conjugative transposon TraM protein n=1 Tax=Catalinimonas alkaloidigena TaxID=1075417 RepID=A0A1G9U3P3_9BACT|nr:conjugative transposon protein TraM [Catalinimonas alkaloidigena]SDM54488.1 Bacteroides conjugative transposon TraM protein [Catalinimonas alkaloidigena]
MKTINFRQPKYVFPLFALPLFLVLFYVFGGEAPVPQAQASAHARLDSLNFKLPAAVLDRRTVKNKLESFTEAYARREDYTAMLELEEEASGKRIIASAYNEEEKRLLDSLQTQLLKGEKEDFLTSVARRAQEPTPAVSLPPSDLARSNQPRRETEEEREMRLFRQQMLLIDSLSKAPPTGKGPADVRPEQPAPPQTPPPVDVQRVASSVQRTRGAFHTIQVRPNDSRIKAILDETLKVEEGSRIRIRLMDQILVGEYLMEKGEYVYGRVTGFAAQRVLITVSDVLLGDTPVPVQLEVYDQDGMPGLYVPGSRFRELTKEMGANLASGTGTQGRLQDAPDNQTEVFYEIADQLLRTSSRAASHAARRNRAELKYNSVLYLVHN